MVKTPGQVAIAAYYKSHDMRDVLFIQRMWQDNSAHWEAAAEAVMMAGLDHMSDTIERDRRLLPTERAVIEAAKAFRPAWLLGRDTEERRQRALLLEAVEALEKESDG